jgi:hypothetical protein
MGDTQKKNFQYLIDTIHQYLIDMIIARKNEKINICFG